MPGPLGRREWISCSMRGDTLHVSWKRFASFIEARAKFASTPCVYAQADVQSRPLRIGKATRGLVSRYRGGTGYALDAAAHASGNLWFVAPVPARLCLAIEHELIWAYRHALPYNNQGKRRAPLRRIHLIHAGSAPAFPSLTSSADGGARRRC